MWTLRLEITPPCLWMLVNCPYTNDNRVWHSLEMLRMVTACQQTHSKRECTQWPQSPALSSPRPINRRSLLLPHNNSLHGNSSLLALFWTQTGSCCLCMTWIKGQTSLLKHTLCCCYTHSLLLLHLQTAAAFIFSVCLWTCSCGISARISEYLIFVLLHQEIVFSFCVLILQDCLLPHKAPGLTFVGG